MASLPTSRVNTVIFKEHKLSRHSSSYQAAEEFCGLAFFLVPAITKT